MGEDNRSPSETLGGGGQISMRAVLELMDRSHTQTNELRIELRRVEDADRARAKELFGKIDALAKEIRDQIDQLKRDDRGRDEKRDDRIDATDKELAALREAVSGLKAKHEDQFADVPWYARPSYIKAVGLSIAAVIGAIAVAWYASSGGPPLPKAGSPPAIEAPEDSGDAGGPAEVLEALVSEEGDGGT